jgi:eukaryotic-like serine/threonine-protein kinase
MSTRGNQRARAQEAANGRLRDEVRGFFGRRRRPKAPPATFPRALSHYELLKEIGAGARGVVYRARDNRLNRIVAIKMLRGYADRESKQRFLREAICASALSHPNIVTIYELGRSDGMNFIVMEYVPGKALNELIAKRGMSLDVCLDYALQIARALAAVHSATMMHRDVKTSNFIVAKKGIVKMFDFGLVKVMGGRSCRSEEQRSKVPKTQEGTVLGTAGYMSPEQVRGQAADQRSDVFSFGALFYEMLTGRRAFQEDTAIETMGAILRKAPPKLPARIPARIAAVLQCCLAKEASGRYKTAKELEAALTRAAQSLLGRTKFSSGSSFQN